MKQHFNREIFLQVVQKQDIQKIIDFLRNNEIVKQMNDDMVIKSFLKLSFVDEFLNQNPSDAASVEKFEYDLQSLYSVHSSTNHIFKFCENDFKKIILRLVELLSATKIDQAYNIAKLFPDEPICQNLLSK